MLVGDYTFCAPVWVCVHEDRAKWKRRGRRGDEAIVSLEDASLCASWDSSFPVAWDLLQTEHIWDSAHVMDFNCLIQFLAACLPSRHAVNHISLREQENKKIKSRATHFHLHVALLQLWSTVAAHLCVFECERRAQSLHTLCPTMAHIVLRL